MLHYAAITVDSNMGEQGANLKHYMLALQRQHIKRTLLKWSVLNLLRVHLRGAPSTTGVARTAALAWWRVGIVGGGCRLGISKRLAELIHH